MKANPHWLSLGRPSGLPYVLAGILIIGTSLPVLSDTNSSLYHKGLEAERSLDLFVARNQFLKTLEMKPVEAGQREHIAWFLYLNGFHNHQCLELLKEVQPVASQPAATKRAIEDLSREMGLSPPISTKKPKRRAAARSGNPLTDRLQDARELFWAGSTTKARKLLESMVSEMPDKPALRWELSKVLISQKAYEEAATQLAKARQLRPNEPELILSQATVEALRGHRVKALRILDDVKLDDPAPAQLIRARAHHYAAESIPAARAYRQVLKTRPHHEMAAHGLAECSLRTNAIPEARDILDSWADVPRAIDWSDRYQLENELTAPRLRLGGSYFENSLDYDEWAIGSDLHLRPRADLDVDIAATYSWFNQDRFNSIERKTLQLSALYQDNGDWGVSGHIGVSDYTNDWTSLTGGIAVMFRPISSLEISLAAAHIDIVDSVPPMGIALYDLASTIGAVGGQATMDSLSAAATWQPIEDVEIFAKYRLATLEGNNTMDDAYASISWLLNREPMLRVGYGVAYMSTEDPAPTFSQGAASTPYYYDPHSVVVHNLYIEYSQQVGDRFTYGAEAHLYLQPENDATGVGLFGFVRHDFNERHSLQLDARYYTQNRGRNRNQSVTGHYDALNFVASYAYRF